MMRGAPAFSVQGPTRASVPGPSEEEGMTQDWKGEDQAAKARGGVVGKTTPGFRGVQRRQRRSNGETELRPARLKRKRGGRSSGLNGSR